MNSSVPQRIIVPFRISYDSMLQDSRTTQDLLQEDLGAFTGLAPEINDEFLTVWREDSAAAGAVQSDESFVDDIEETTQEVQAAMAEARRVYIRTKFAVTRAWPGNVAKGKQFGFDDYDKARQSDKLLYHFMDALHQRAQDNADALAAVNFDAPEILSIRTAADGILAADRAQENLKKDRLALTQDRTIKLTAVWTKRQLVAAAAKVLYMDNYAKYQQYLLPPSESAPEDFAIMGQIVNADGALLEGVQVRIDALDLNTTSDSQGMYGIVDNIPPGDYGLTFTLDGYATMNQEVEVRSADETITLNVVMTAG